MQLWLLPLVLFFFSSCSFSVFPGYHPASGSGPDAPLSWFQPDTGHYLFNTSIDLMKKHFSGLMVVKTSGTGEYRVVMLTEVGLKVFDMEFAPDTTVKVNYIMDPMNKKALINTLSDDISLVLMNRIVTVKPDRLSDKRSNDRIFRYKDHGRKYYYYVAGSSGFPYFAKQTGRITNKVKAYLYGNNNSGIDSLKISHYNFGLSINLNRINEIKEHVSE